MAKVSVVECKSYNQNEVDKAVKKSLELIGFDFGKPKTVLIKPNVLGAYKPEEAVTTHPAVIKAVCKLLKGSKIYVGDSAGVEGTTQKSLEISGIKEAAESYKTKVISFDSAKLVKIKTENKYLKGIYVPKILFDVDMIVNLPKLKTHSFTLYTGAIKNTFGCVVGGQKGKLHSATKTCEEFSKMLVDLHYTIKPSINIMDAVIGMEGFGPSSGVPKKTGLILASTNSAALDHTAAEIIGFDPLKLPMVNYAMEKFPFKVDMIGKKHQIYYKKLLTFAGRRWVPEWLIQFIVKKQIVIDRQKCKKCMVCVKHCPVKAMSKDIKVGKDCIQCFCCQELCPHHAISLNNNLLFTICQFVIRQLRRFG